MSTVLDIITLPSYSHLPNTYGAPPTELLAQLKSPITDFFFAADFVPVLSEEFLQQFANRQPAWGPIGYVTYKRTYARPLYAIDFGGDDVDKVVRTEEIDETLTRIINGLWHIIRCHSARKNIDFSEEIAQRKAEHMFMRLWNFKWLPPGRGMWMMGTKQMYLKGSAALQNCAFVSTQNIEKEGSEPFAWAMDMSMLGVGIGFDTKGAGKVEVKLPSNIDVADLVTSSNLHKSYSVSKKTWTIGTNGSTQEVTESDDVFRTRLATTLIPQDGNYTTYYSSLHESGLLFNVHRSYTHLDTQKDYKTHIIPDTREGWVESVAIVINAFLKGKALPLFDYSLIRKRGEPIRGFGGIAEGPEFLQKCHENLVTFFLDRIDSQLTATDIVDIFNEIGACVVSGNVRRCLPVGTIVHTTKGGVPIEEIQVGDTITTLLGNYPVLAKFDQGIQETIKIKHSFGTFECTPNHKMAIFDSMDTWTFKEAQYLTKDDQLVWDSVGYQGSTTALPPYTNPIRKAHDTNSQNIIIPTLDIEIAWLIGLFHGDGYVFIPAGLTPNGSVTIACHSNATEQIQKAVKALARFNVKVRVKETAGNWVRIVVHSNQLAEYFHNNIKQAKTELHIPGWISNSTRDIRGAYLAGLFDADGSCLTRPLQLVSTVYQKYANEVKNLAASLGIAVKVQPSERREEDWQTQYHLGIKGNENVLKFEEVIAGNSTKYTKYEAITKSQNSFAFSKELVLASSNDRSYIIPGPYITSDRIAKSTGQVFSSFPVRIIEIEKGRRVETYDIEVASIHQFTAEGFVTHNSAQISLGEPTDENFISLKHDSINHPNCWNSNNSAFATVGMDYTRIAQLIASHGEPGLIWLENMQKYGRMGEANYKDSKAMGTNPCFSADTLIAVADGRQAVRIEDLAKTGEDVPVYSVDQAGKVSIKWARQPRLTRTSAELVRITLDDSSTLEVTPDHKMLLLDGTWKYAKDLLEGDSLPRLTKRLERITTQDNNANLYVRVNCNTQDTHKDKIFEHRLIAQFHEPELWDSKYQEQKQSGWIKGGLVVHHKDYNSLNNSPSNLEIMTFRDHSILHASIDKTGENNGMYGRHHSDDSKKKIGDKTLARMSNPEYKKHWYESNYTPENRKKFSDSPTVTRKKVNQEYWSEQAQNTNLDTIWIDGRLHANKTCEICKAQFIVTWGFRTQAYCSMNCVNTYLSGLEKRKNNQRIAFQDKQRQTFHEQIITYKDLEFSLGRTPMKKEWEAACKDKGIPFRTRAGDTREQYISSFTDLVEKAQTYNHRVKSVEILDGIHNVYNLTVDDNHTVGIITSISDTVTSGIYTFQCGEQTLHNYEMCCLVENFPSRHEDESDFLDTLKQSYLYAKTVTLVPSHNKKTNAVMGRNSRIGCSLSGVQDARAKFGTRAFLSMCDIGYQYIQSRDQIYSDWLQVRRSIKYTSLKPSGTISLLSGVKPGIHRATAKYRFKNMRFSRTNPMVDVLQKAGYSVFPAPEQPESTVCIAFPVMEEYMDKTEAEAAESIWEQLEFNAQMQEVWSDNQNSITVKFKQKPGIELEIKAALEMYETRLKAVSFLPYWEVGETSVYEGMPEQPITEEQYLAAVSVLKPYTFGQEQEDDLLQDECTTGVCPIR